MRQARQIWAELVRQQEKSGLSVSEFATQREIPAKTLYYWRSKLRQEENPPSLLPVRVISSRSPLASRSEAQEAPAVEVMVVRFASGAANELVAEVVNRLRQC